VISPDQIQATLVAAYRLIAQDAVARIAQALQSGGALDSLIAQAAHDGADEPLRDLLSYREALRERADPARLVARLEAEAADLEARANHLAEQAAEFFGKAAYRQQHGERGLASDFQKRAEAAEQVGGDLRRQAFHRRIECDRLHARMAQAAALHLLVTAA
jgi:hypothetical protein